MGDFAVPVNKKDRVSETDGPYLEVAVTVTEYNPGDVYFFWLVLVPLLVVVNSDLEGTAPDHVSVS